jgi:hypothetical protein
VKTFVQPAIRQGVLFTFRRSRPASPYLRGAASKKRYGDIVPMNRASLAGRFLTDVLPEMLLHKPLLARSSPANIIALARTARCRW